MANIFFEVVVVLTISITILLALFSVAIYANEQIDKEKRKIESNPSYDWGLEVVGSNCSLGNQTISTLKVTLNGTNEDFIEKRKQALSDSNAAIHLCQNYSISITANIK